MKKISTAALILTGLFTVSSVAIAAPDDNSQMPTNPNGQQAKRNLDLTQQDVKTLVQAGLIKHNKSNLTIQKINEINLADGKKFYLVYVAEANQSTADSFLIVDAQSGRIMPFPKPKHGKNHRQGGGHGGQKNRAINFSDQQ